MRELDVLRGLAILLVLGRHMTAPSLDVLPPIRAIGAAWHDIGWMGVDLFFVLSGFLVGGLLFGEYQRQGSLHIGRFLIRRGFKIYPLFYVFLAVTVLVELTAGTLPQTGHELLAEAVYLQGYAGHYWSHTWSLAIEEHFYVLLPLAVSLAARRPGGLARAGPPLLWGILALGAVALALRIRAWQAYTLDPSTVYLYQTHLRLDSLAWGVGLAYVFHFHHDRLMAAARRWRWALLGGSTALVLPAATVPWDRWWSFAVSLPMLAWGFAGFLALALARPFRLTPWIRPPGAGWLGRVVAATGVASYGIYLWHLAVRDWLVVHVREAGLFSWGPPTLAYVLEGAMFVAASLAVGFTLAHVFERPVLALRDRWFPSRSGAPAAALLG